jgi:hypothetical protein
LTILLVLGLFPDGIPFTLLTGRAHG